MANLVKTGLGGRRRISKDSDKGIYEPVQFFMPGSGIVLEYESLATQPNTHDSEGRVLYPQGSQTVTALKISASGIGETTTSGYNGIVTVSGAVFTVENGLIVDVS